MLACRLIHALTVIQRDPVARDFEWWDAKIFRLIHWLSAWGAQGVTEDEILVRLGSHTLGDEAMANLANAAVAMLNLDK